MRQKINWQLTSNNSVLVDLKDVYCTYEINKYLEFKENEILNFIDLLKRKYKRISEEYTMEIDFPKNICTFSFQNQEKCSFDIESDIKVDENVIILEYNIGDEKKIITVNMKED